MIICGLKLTHDGAVSVVENNRLLFSIEMEKLQNNLRYTSIEDTRSVKDILAHEGVDLKSIDYFAVDGWGGYDQDALAIQPRLEIGETSNRLSIHFGGVAAKIDVAQYTERTLKHPVTEGWKFNNLVIGDESFEYYSYLHACTHLFSAYCTSPFARRDESAYILLWDGGMFPRLYFYDARAREVTNLGPIFLLIGNIYTIFSQHFGPFKVKDQFAKDNLSIAGKVMAYVAKGTCREPLFSLFDKIITEHYDSPMGFANKFANLFKRAVAQEGYSDEDILRTFHEYLERMLVQKLAKKIGRHGSSERRLCIAGGCALNIKWNSAIRGSGLFTEVYVPPFPNDSGSAIGAACSVMAAKSKTLWLDWNVYTGPALNAPEVMDGWTGQACTIKELAKVLFQTREPVVFLNQRAELGPRALGNRSILAVPDAPAMQDLLNQLKEREAYRPVSPICMEERAGEIFEPGTKDPYMLFDHKVKEAWKSKIPAVCHLDGTARLQTVSRADNEPVYELLEEFEALSGLPLLCNTSANLKGSGFFPDVQSAMQWGRANYIWSHNVLYQKADRIKFQ